jgi:hypothetical protein
MRSGPTFPEAVRTVSAGRTAPVKIDVVPALCQELLDALPDRLAGSSRRERTTVLEAAHTIIFVASFLEAVDTEGAPRWSRGLKAAMLGPIMEVEPPLPDPTRGPVVAHDSFLAVFQSIAKLADTPSNADMARLEAFAGKTGLRRATFAYSRRYVELGQTYPELLFWSGQLRGEPAVRWEDVALAEFVGDVRPAGGLSGLADLMRAVRTSEVADERWKALGRVYQAALARPIVEVGDSPESLNIPVLREAYVSPRFIVREVVTGVDPSQESYWGDRSQRSDLDAFLVAFLTSSAATEAPLAVLGQPGSGK